MSDAVMDAAPAEQEASAPAAPPRTFDTIDAAVAELERRAAERRAAAKAEKAKATGEEAAPTEVDEPQADPKARKLAQAEDADAEDGDDEQDEADDADEGDDGEDDSDDEREEATADEDEDEQPTKVVRLDGKEVEIPAGTPRALVETVSKLAEDLKSDYTRKTQEVANDRQAMAEAARSNDALIQQVQRAQQAVVKMAQQMLGEPPPLELAQTDIQAYTIQKALYEQRVQQLQALSQEAGGLTQAQQQRQAQERQQQLTEELQRAIKVMPRLADPQTRSQFAQAAAEAAGRSGFTQDDVASIGDHRMLHLLGRLVDAEARLAALDKAGQSVNAKLKNVPPKVVKAGAANPDQGRGDKARRAKADFLRSGRTMKDVQRYLAATER